MAIRDLTPPPPPPPQGTRSQFEQEQVLCPCYMGYWGKNLNLSQCLKLVLKLHFPPMMVRQDTIILQRVTNMIFPV